MGWDPSDPRGPWQEPNLPLSGSAGGDYYPDQIIRAASSQTPKNNNAGEGAANNGHPAAIKKESWNDKHDSVSTSGNGYQGTSNNPPSGYSKPASAVSKPSTPSSNSESASNNGHPPSSGKNNTGPSKQHVDAIKNGGIALGGLPIILDLNGNGIDITDISKSTQFRDTGDDGLLHRTAWAGAGDGVLFVDVDGDGKISNTLEYVFTEWDNTAKTDMQALRSAFDSNGDGKLTAADTDSPSSR